MARILRLFIFIILLAILPFVLLIRISVYVHVSYELSAYTCLFVGIGCTTVLLFLYFTVVHGFLTGSIGDYAGIKRRSIIAFLIVLLYGFHALFFFSSSNVKSQELRVEYLQMHPLLRLSTSTLAYMDKKLILTDAERIPEDYRKMGLPSKKASLHYKQSDGYVYALDLRVNDRSEIRNLLMTTYFRMMGFKTLRHLGTADHLHVSLHNHDLPSAR
jgi:hypothetical protein